MARGFVKGRAKSFKTGTSSPSVLRQKILKGVPRKTIVRHSSFQPHVRYARPLMALRSGVGFFFRHMASRQRASDEGLYETYDVLHVLGRGAYATVVKAFHKKECKMYAVKMFSADKLRQILENTASRGHDRSSTTSHLQKEVQILEKMKHPNICKLKEAFYEGYSVSTWLSCFERRRRCS